MTGSGRLTDTTDPTRQYEAIGDDKSPEQVLEYWVEKWDATYTELVDLRGRHERDMVVFNDNILIAERQYDELVELRAQLAAARRTEAETKAEALQEAADDVEVVIGQWPGSQPEWVRTDDPTFNGGLRAALRMLRVRARAASLLAQPETPEQRRPCPCDRGPLGHGCANDATDDGGVCEWCADGTYPGPALVLPEESTE